MSSELFSLLPTGPPAGPVGAVPNAARGAGQDVTGFLAVMEEKTSAIVTDTATFLDGDVALTESLLAAAFAAAIPLQAVQEPVEPPVGEPLAASDRPDAPASDESAETNGPPSAVPMIGLSLPWTAPPPTDQLPVASEVAVQGELAGEPGREKGDGANGAPSGKTEQKKPPVSSRGDRVIPHVAVPVPLPAGRLADAASESATGITAADETARATTDPETSVADPYRIRAAALNRAAASAETAQASSDAASSSMPPVMDGSSVDVPQAPVISPAPPLATAVAVPAPPAVRPSDRSEQLRLESSDATDADSRSSSVAPAGTASFAIPVAAAESAPSPVLVDGVVAPDPATAAPPAAPASASFGPAAPASGVSSAQASASDVARLAVAIGHGSAIDLQQDVSLLPAPVVDPIDTGAVPPTRASITAAVANNEIYRFLATQVQAAANAIELGPEATATGRFFALRGQAAAQATASTQRAATDFLGTSRLATAARLPLPVSRLTDAARPAPYTGLAARAESAAPERTPARQAFATAAPLDAFAPFVAETRTAATAPVSAPPNAGAPFAPPSESTVASPIIQAMRLQWANGVNRAVVNLQPDYLGAVQIELQVTQGAVTATVHAANPQVRAWLEAHESTLRLSLADQGLKLDRLIVREEAATEEAANREQRRRQPVPERDFRRPPRRDETGTFTVVV